jgi:hypothetical protein
MAFVIMSISGGIEMVLKSLFIAVVCSALLAWSGLSVADEYRPDEFLGLDLSGALLSLMPLGPPTEFTPVPVEAKADREGESAEARAEPKVEPKIVIHKTRVAHRGAERPHSQETRAAHIRAEKPRGPARTNPLDAQAFDTRIQVWPCRSGGICNWKR